MSILGLQSSSDLTGVQSLDIRRKVFYQYPNGAAPLMGLLSMMDDGDGETDKPSWGWNEERFPTFQAKTAQANSAGPFTDTSGSNGAAGTDLTAAGWGLAGKAAFRVFLNDVSLIQERDVLEFRNIPGTSSSEKTFQGVITAVYPTENSVDVLLIETVANVLNTTAANAMDVIIVSSAAAEGDRSKTGFRTLPIEVYNYTQIFRHSFNFTRNALKMGLKFDSSGTYKSTAKINSLKHMKLLEYAFLFGRRSSYAATTDDGDTTVRRTLGGIRWFLEQYEKGNTSNGGQFDYRPNGSDISGDAWDSSDDKRILDFANADITGEEFEDRIIQNAFRYTNDESYEKIALCGQRFLSEFNKYAKNASLKTIDLHSKEDTFGMKVTSWETAHGVLHFKSHPLLAQTDVHNSSAFILDMGELKYTPFQDSDTTLLKNRQPRDYDGRKDEWLTEAGLELHYPENHMFLDRLGSITL